MQCLLAVVAVGTCYFLLNFEFTAQFTELFLPLAACYFLLNFEKSLARLAIGIQSYTLAIFFWILTEGIYKKVLKTRRVNLLFSFEFWCRATWPRCTPNDSNVHLLFSFEFWYRRFGRRAEPEQKSKLNLLFSFEFWKDRGCGEKWRVHDRTCYFLLNFDTFSG